MVKQDWRGVRPVQKAKRIGKRLAAEAAHAAAVLRDRWAMAPWRASSKGPATRPAGIFLTHLVDRRIEAHFERLKRESGHLVDWHFVLNRWTLADQIDPATDFPAPGLLPLRVKEAVANDRRLVNHMDVLILPFAWATGADNVWIVEYDVDFSGNWSRFFRQFANNSADLLATTLFRRSQVPNWFHWASARSPVPIPPDKLVRSFIPMMRVSRPLLQAYFDAMREPGWGGNYEYLLPTVALQRGFIVEDIGGRGPLTPLARFGRNYSNTPKRTRLGPGTFVFRPPTPTYFHEDPSTFRHSNMLYHPVKPLGLTPVKDVITSPPEA